METTTHNTANCSNKTLYNMDFIYIYLKTVFLPNHKHTPLPLERQTN